MIDNEAGMNSDFLFDTAPGTAVKCMNRRHQMRAADMRCGAVRNSRLAMRCAPHLLPSMPAARNPRLGAWYTELYWTAVAAA